MRDSVRSVEVTLLRVPLSRPMRTATFEIPGIDTALVQVRTAGGLEGVGWAFGFGKGRAASIARMVEDLSPLIVGADPTQTARLWQVISNATAFTGRKGIGALAVSAIDTACWDVAAKSADVPVFRLLGGSGDPVTAYASQGLWLDRSRDELVSEAAGMVESGFGAIKMRAGLANQDADIERIAAVREAIGPDVKLMVDVNQGWDVATTARMSRRMEPYDIFWLEEPYPVERTDWYRQTSGQFGVPLCTGESNYHAAEIAELVTGPGPDYLMLDLMRMSGVTEWMRAAHVCGVFGRTISPHLFAEHSIHLAAASTNCIWLEYMPWWDPILSEPLEPKDGCIAPPDRPGFGIELDGRAVARYQA